MGVTGAAASTLGPGQDPLKLFGWSSLEAPSWFFWACAHLPVLRQPKGWVGRDQSSWLGLVSSSCLVSCSECTPAEARADRDLIAWHSVAPRNKSSFLGCQELAGGGDSNNPFPSLALMLQYISNLPGLPPPPNLLGQGRGSPARACPSPLPGAPRTHPASISQAFPLCPFSHLEFGECETA